MKKTWTMSLAAAVLAAGLLTGCSGGGGDDAKDDPETVVDETPTESEGSESDGSSSKKKDTYTDVRDPQGSVEDYVGAMGDATVDSCDTEDGSLVATGTVTNSENDAQQYRIYVSAMDGSDTRGIVQVDLDPLEGGATADWDASFDLADEGLSCILRVERFDPLD